MQHRLEFPDRETRDNWFFGLRQLYGHFRGAPVDAETVGRAYGAMLFGRRGRMVGVESIELEEEHEDAGNAV